MEWNWLSLLKHLLFNEEIKKKIKKKIHKKNSSRQQLDMNEISFEADKLKAKKSRKRRNFK